jgi:cytochrome oxidase Cu insertion factor (SCO1/SenC/PrrC family)
MTNLPSTSPPRRPFPKILIVGAILIAVLGLYRFWPGHASASSDLRRINIVPPFTLTERSGRTITNNDLFGKIWIAAFVYTTCPGPCPLVTASMAKLQTSLAHDPQVQLVTFTVDPINDTPAVLAAYADHFGASKDRWWFLTGPEKQQDDLIQHGFFLPVVDNRGNPAEGQYTVTHSTQLALVDANGVVRGYYDGTTAEGREAVLKAIGELEKE